ncbi:hypothetical protein AJ80_05565 [Polytolypa hystricis UAMH7299]|uniref:Uncharacterized protein n=1 Tax=Polytolypa hystricis (strain UAMH7299) TaxID=1447883 RepID=A0A2B7Y2W0_POLH7|nr:hypothetical protein AJ80_05565 [Polytolypa hystricis UAMH7299]
MLTKLATVRNPVNESMRYSYLFVTITGSAVTSRFAQAYPGVLLARSPLSFDPLVHDITQSGNSAIGIPTDVSNSSSLDSTMDQIETQFGPDLRVAAASYSPNLLDGNSVPKAFMFLTLLLMVS